MASGHDERTVAERDRGHGVVNLPKRRKPQPLGVKEAPQIRNASHLRWIRGFECAVMGTGMQCYGRIEAAHARTGTDGGTSLKPGDNWTLPLCSEHHAMQHRIGEASFERLHGIDMKNIAQALWLKSPHRRTP
jgi:hypothetical protein